MLLAMMVLAMLRVPLSFKMPPPLMVAELPERVELVRVTVLFGLLKIPPPLLDSELPEMVELETVRVPRKLLMPPPLLVALLSEMVELETVRVPRKLSMPPPLNVEILLEMVELETVMEPEFLKPPPAPAVLPEIVELERLRAPLLLNAPPAPGFCAPVSVTPEIERLPPVTIVKILKPPAVPLMISEEEPGPVMVRVPTVVPVPPVPEAVALAAKMVGNAAVKVMVPVTPVLKTISSLPGVVLARVIAASRDPGPEAAVFRTVIGAGTTLSSSPRSSS